MAAALLTGSAHTGGSNEVSLARLPLYSFHLLLLLWFAPAGTGCSRPAPPTGTEGAKFSFHLHLSSTTSKGITGRMRPIVSNGSLGAIGILWTDNLCRISCGPAGNK